MNDFSLLIARGRQRAQHRSRGRRRARTSPRRVIRAGLRAAAGLRGPHRRHGHGEIGAHRQQDRGDARQHRQPRVFPAPGRGHPRRRRHDHRQGRGSGPFQFRRDRRTADDPADHQAARCAADRIEWQDRLDLVALCDGYSRRERTGRSVSVESCADRQHHGHVGHGRCARHRRPRGARIHCGRFCAFPPGRHALDVVC